ncbi:AAA family ATPase, partial [bacterium]|nr:AAA family ATPase [bacterium]
FNGTAAIRNCVLQASSLALSADRKEIVDVSDPEKRIELFCEILEHLKVDRSREEPKLYKPAMLACVVEAIEQEELSENKIPFDWIAPRFIKQMAALGEEVGNEQAAQAFCHLKGDMIWLHAVINSQDPMKDGREGPSAAREKVKYALIKDTFWECLQDPKNRHRARNTLHEQWFSADRSILPNPQDQTSSSTLDDSFIPAVTSAIKGSGLIFEEAFLQRFLFSLLAKPFVILTGTSGTGKTQLALKFAQWLVGENGYELVPVGADWTDNRQVLGQYNPFDKVFVSTRVLDILLRADSDPARPYFLILDEMNLSHVERYFADFLSGIESGDSISLHRNGSDVKTAKGVAVPEEIKIPDNLFIVGTVNIDETTYMFSPKVLDRANVLEFSITKDGFTQFFDNAVGKLEIPSGGGSIHALGFLAHAKKIRFDDLGRSEMEAYQSEIRKTLLELFSLLEETGMEFAFRAASEIDRYCRAAFSLTQSDSRNLRPVLDAQILQKILPKLHGSRRRIEPLLAGLCEYCAYADREAAAKLMGKYGEGIQPLSEDGDAKFLLSYRKLVRMIRAVRRDQFVSFIQ